VRIAHRGEARYVVIRSGVALPSALPRDRFSRRRAAAARTGSSRVSFLLVDDIADDH